MRGTVFGVELRGNRRALSTVGTAVALILIAGVTVGALLLISATSDPERAQNSCARPVAWTKAEGSFSMSSTVSFVSGTITRAEVRVQGTEYSSSGGLHLPFLSLFGKKGSVWVRSYMTGPSGEVSDTRDSEKVPYDFALLSLQSGGVDGTFRTGEACVSSHGKLTWHFDLLAQDSGSDTQPFTLDTEQRTVDA